MLSSVRLNEVFDSKHNYDIKTDNSVPSKTHAIWKPYTVNVFNFSNLATSARTKCDTSRLLVTIYPENYIGALTLLQEQPTVAVAAETVVETVASVAVVAETGTITVPVRWNGMVAAVGWCNNGEATITEVASEGASCQGQEKDGTEL